MVLLEVVLGLALFFITAVFVMDGLSASLRAVDKARLDSTAADLTVTVMSEIQLGLVPMQDEGPHPFDRLGYEQWTWEIVVMELDDLTQFPQLKQVEAIIRNDDEQFTHRKSQLMWEDPNAGEEEEAEEELPELPGVPGGLP